MSIFAGIIASAAGRRIPSEHAEAFVRTLSRHASDEPVVIKGHGHLFAQVVLPSQICHGHWTSDDGRMTLLAGAPLLGVPDKQPAQMLHDALRRDDLSVLSLARGGYCVAHWDPKSLSLRLITDKLGLRPIYCAWSEDCFYFSTALRVFEQANLLTREIDIRAVTELAAFGYSLSDRTPYAAIRVLRAGEEMRVAEGSSQVTQYWSWDHPPDEQVALETRARAIFGFFVEAVRLRLGTQDTVLAGLSGGLDSRCIVAALQACGVTVHTFNFAPVGSADLVLGRLAAKALGTEHSEYPTGPTDFWDRMHGAHDAWLRYAREEDLPSKIFQLWSGDGGSCGLGHIYLTERMIELMRCGKTDAAIAAYLDYNRIGLPGRLFRRSERARLLAYPALGVADELNAFKRSEVGRRLHLFLMLNGQRRLLARHYENIDLRRFELITPFFDTKFLQAVLTCPIDVFLLHRFYNSWLQEFPSAVTAVSWQSYPDHAPSDLPQPNGARNQWDGWYDDDAEAALKHCKLQQAKKLLQSQCFPSDLIDRRVLWLARWFTRLGVGDYQHVINCAATYARYQYRY